ncbi:MAG TPA: hypothetical protein VGG83_02430 [Trebonia sp.]
MLDLAEGDAWPASEGMLVRERDVTGFARDHEQSEAVRAERRPHDRDVGLAAEQAASRIAEVEVPGAECDLRVTRPERLKEHGRERERGGSGETHPQPARLP